MKTARELFIELKLRDHYKDVEKLGYEVFGVFLQGSQNYNLDICSNEYTSDVDTKAIVLPTFDEFCRNKSPISYTYVRENNEHIDIKDIRVMFETFKKQNVNFVEILFTDFYIVNEKYEKFYEKLRDLAEELVHANPAQTVKTMYGMSTEKRKALQHPYPTIIDKINKYGYDGKQLHHILRISIFLSEYIKGTTFKECLTKYSSQDYLTLMDCKLNKIPCKQAVFLADFWNNFNKKLAENFIEEHKEDFNAYAYFELDTIKIDVLKQWFKEQIFE